MMRHRSMVLPALVLLSISCCVSAFGVPVDADKKTVVVTGATGRTGSLLYNRLKADGQWNVRAFIRNATKAKGILGCHACDESEGVFVGDITMPTTIEPA